MTKKISDNISNNIFNFSNIKCHVCQKKITVYNMTSFFNYPNNNFKFFYCSKLCFNHI